MSGADARDEDGFGVEAHIALWSAGIESKISERCSEDENRIVQKDE